LREIKFSEKLIQEEVDNAEVKIDQKVEEDRANNIKKCMGHDHHDHDHEDGHYINANDKRVNRTKCVKDTIIMFLMDILLFAFFCTQEFNDASHLESIIMQASYTRTTIIHAGVISHLIVNSLSILIAWLYCGLALTQGEGHFIACVIIYFIIGYETLFHVLPLAGRYLDLDEANNIKQSL
jgi:putative Ca2+/H+ antiporter (TMEM165/GDT1 family)